jgi:hypothetical protein
MATWSVWFPDVLVHVPGAPDPLVSQALNRAAREFFRRTRAWTEWLEPLATVAGEGREYDLELPPQTDVVRLERATVGGAPLAITAWRQLERDPAQHGEGDRALVSGDLLAFRLRGLFAAGEQLQVQVALMPKTTATGIPDALATRYLEPIAEGAKAQLLATASAPFHDPKAATVAQLAFERAVAQHGVDVFRGHSSHVPRAAVSWC